MGEGLFWLLLLLCNGTYSGNGMGDGLLLSFNRTCGGGSMGDRSLLSFNGTWGGGNTGDGLPLLLLLLLAAFADILLSELYSAY